MADHSRYQRGIVQRYYEHADTIALQRLSEIVSDLYLAEGGGATRLWTSAKAALTKLAPPDDPRVAKALASRSVTDLARLVNELSASAKATGRNTAAAKPGEDDLDRVVGAPAAPTPPPIAAAPGTPSAPAAASAAPTPEQLKNAMKAFRKRLKLTKLDEESKLGRVGNPMSGGKKSQVVAIMAPREFPSAVWEELARQGKLKSAGGSFYALGSG